MTPTPSKPLVFLASLALALACACAWLAAVLARDKSGRALDSAQALADPRVQREVIERLVRESQGMFDSHPDPDVGRVLKPGLDFVGLDGIPIRSNDLGLRERPFEMPPAADVLRIVFLGDSYVMGSGARAEDRMGVFLEGFLAERARGFSGAIECLHVGIASWDLIAECAFLRGVLADLQPDLVIQLTVQNDLDDLTGVRGFGVQAKYSPRERRRADSLVTSVFPRAFGDPLGTNLLAHGLDWESRERFAAAARALRELAADLVRTGCAYVLVGHWYDLNAKLAQALASHLDPQAQAWLPANFDADPALQISPQDPHWNRLGHERFAKLAFGIVRERGLLPELALAPWPEAEELARTTLGRGLAEATEPEHAIKGRAQRPVAARIDFRTALPEVMGQVHGGIDADGLVSPYASICMRTEGGAFVRVRGRALDAGVLDGSRVQVFVEEAPVGELVLAAGEPIDARLALPPEISARPFVSVRFVSDDWIYAGPWRQHCVVFDLEELAIER